MDVLRPRADVEPIAMGTNRTIQVFTTTVRIQHLTIDRPKIIAYLDAVAPEKQELALIHALELGIAELNARRERFKR